LKTILENYTENYTYFTIPKYGRRTYERYNPHLLICWR